MVNGQGSRFKSRVSSLKSQEETTTINSNSKIGIIHRLLWENFPKNPNKICPQNSHRNPFVGLFSLLWPFSSNHLAKSKSLSKILEKDQIGWPTLLTHFRQRLLRSVANRRLISSAQLGSPVCWGGSQKLHKLAKFVLLAEATTNALAWPPKASISLEWFRNSTQTHKINWFWNLVYWFWARFRCFMQIRTLPTDGGYTKTKPKGCRKFSSQLIRLLLLPSPSPLRRPTSQES